MRCASPDCVPDQKHDMSNNSAGRSPGMKGGSPPPRPTVAEALRKAGRQMLSVLPILTGVVLLVGLLRAAVPTSVINAVFSGAILRDTVFGSLLAFSDDDQADMLRNALHRLQEHAVPLSLLEGADNGHDDRSLPPTDDLPDTSGAAGRRLGDTDVHDPYLALRNAVYADQ